MLALLPHLRAHERVSLGELAAAVGATVEDVAEDLTLLSFCGVPPFSPYDMVDLMIDGDSVEVFMAAPALERPVRLSAAETRALVAALETTGHEPGDPLVGKLLAAVAAPLDAEALMAVVRGGGAGGGGGSAGIRETYEVLAEALEAGEAVEISYFTGSSGRQSVRVVRPYSMVNERGAWYVTGFCELAGEVRTFRVDRIREARATGARFERAEGASAAREAEARGAWARGAAGVAPRGEELPRAVLLLRGGAPWREERDWPGAEFLAREGGAVEVRVPYSSPWWVARRVCAGLGTIEVVEPEEVRRAVCEVAAGAGAAGAGATGA